MLVYLSSWPTGNLLFKQSRSDQAEPTSKVSNHGDQPPVPSVPAQEAIFRRDGGMCCITGKKGTADDPLIVAPVIPIPSMWCAAEPRNPNVIPMLSAFFGAPYRDWWLAYIRNPERMEPLNSHWLVRQSAAKAYAKGLVAFQRLPSSWIEYNIQELEVGVNSESIEIDGHLALLGDRSRRGLPKVDPKFPGTHARFTESMRWLALVEDMEKLNTPKPKQTGLGTSFLGLRSGLASLGSSFTQRLGDILLAIWRRFPDSMRVAFYKLLRKVGHRLYGRARADTANTQRLPFGLYFKTGAHPEVMRNEFRALQIVREHTNIPVPRPIDLAFIPDGVDSDNDQGFMVMSRMPGHQLAVAHDMISELDEAGFVAQMQDYLRQLRNIPNIVSSEYQICNTLGGPLRDERDNWGAPRGPYADEAAFSKFLPHADDPGRSGHEIYFTHGDLNDRNVLIGIVPLPDGSRGWRVTGIVDWQFAGFLPEYCEYTKSMYEGFRFSKRVQQMYHTIFKGLGDYTKEYDVEFRPSDRAG